MRITREVLNLRIAKLIALRGNCGRLKVGCILTRDHRIIASGYNGPLSKEADCSPETCDINSSCNRAVHAEANAIYFAARDGVSLDGATIWCTHSPCIDCCEAIIQSGIIKVFFIEQFRDEAPIRRLLDSGVHVTQITLDEQENKVNELVWL